jgi:hypothetical protein
MEWTMNGPPMSGRLKVEERSGSYSNLWGVAS